MLNKEIESLKNEHKKNEKEKSDMRREFDNIINNMEEDKKKRRRDKQT
jgi:hypothetical protein